MKNPTQRKITDILRGILVAFAILGLQGCAVRVGAYRFSMGENIQANLYIADNTPPLPEIYDPEVIIVDNGIRHDLFFYQRHPERFAHRSHFYGNPKFSLHETRIASKNQIYSDFPSRSSGK